jgi:hypothetical protein
MKKIILLILIALFYACDKDSSTNFIEIEFKPTNSNKVYLNEKLTVKVTYNIANDETEMLGFRTSHVTIADNSNSNFEHTAKLLDKRSGSYEYEFVVLNLPVTPEKKFSYQVTLSRRTSEDTGTVLAKSNIVQFNVLGFKE